MAKWCLEYAPRVLLHAANLRHGTDNFTSLPKEGVLTIFLSPFKNPTASAGFEPAKLGIRGQHATSAPPKPLVHVLYSLPIPVAARSKAWICGLSLVGIVGSNAVGGMDVSCECCVLSGRGLCYGSVTCPEESY